MVNSCGRLREGYGKLREVACKNVGRYATIRNRPKLSETVRNFVSVVFVTIALTLLCAPAFAASGRVYQVTIDDYVINPIVHAHIFNAIQKAEAENARALVIVLDTPGGLLTSTRTIVKYIMNAKVPVIVYIAPSGARAGSAGVFITQAAHVAAMAPSTNIGAAHPVGISGQSSQDCDRLYENVKKLFDRRQGTDATLPADDAADGDAMSDKITNDSAAWIKSLAEKRGRNAVWAEQAVTKSVSQTETEALALKVVDYVVSDVKELLTKIDGKTVHVYQGHAFVLQTKDAEIVPFDFSLRERILLSITHPNIAYILMMLGFYGLLFEMTHPGFGVPGVAGVICLIVAFFSMSLLPLNYAGLLLIVVGIILFIAEVHVVSYGFLTLGGVVSTFIGSLLLIDSSEQMMRVSVSVILPFVLTTAGLTVFLVGAALKAHRRRAVTGVDGMIGHVGIADADFDQNKEGVVRIHGELWRARSQDVIKTADRVKILSMDGLLLVVGKIE